MSHPTWGLSRDFRVSTMFYGCAPRPTASHPMLRRSLLTAALGAALLVPAADAAEHVPGEVVVRYRARTAGSRRTEVVEAAPGETRARDDRSGSREQPRVLSATKNVIARAALMPNDPGRGRRRGGWQDAPVELHRPVRRQRARGLGQPRGGGPARRPRRRRRGARHGRRLRRSRALRALARPPRGPLRARLRLRRRATTTRTTSTATARTSPPRSPRASTTQSA